MKIFIVTFFLCSLSATTSAYVQTKLINNVSLALEDVYNYFLKHGKANLGGFKGVLLSKGKVQKEIVSEQHLKPQLSSYTRRYQC